MDLLWLVIALIVLVDAAALGFAADTRPGLEHSARRWDVTRRWNGARGKDRRLTGRTGA